jgi:hypothetical protein
VTVLPTPTAQFASHRAELLIVENPAQPVFENGRPVRTTPGKYHQFSEHRCRVEGQRSIDFMRERSKAPDGPEIYELDASDVPTVTELLRELAVADVDRVRQILKAEQDGPARDEVMETAKAVLDKAGVAERGPGRPAAKSRHELVTD